jgi:hypothetical protein
VSLVTTALIFLPSLAHAQGDTLHNLDRLSRGAKGILMTGITVTTLLTSAATASAQNIFEALFGGQWSSPVTVPDANFTARDRQQLANPPYQQAWIPPAYRRQIVQYNRKEAPGEQLQWRG